MKEKIPVVILTSRGPRHSYFCRELAKHFEVRGIVVDVRYGFWHRLAMLFTSHGLSFFSIAKTLALKKKLRPFEERDEKMEKSFFPNPAGEREFPSGIPVLKSSNPNDEKTQKWVQALKPEVLAVFGTRIIQEKMLGLARLGALNIHTGLSPYYRGGQCTFWCLYERDLEHVGVTIHHLTQRIDGGDIVYTAQPVVEPADTVRSLECKLVKLGTTKMIQAISGIYAGVAPRTKQDRKGKLFLSKMYTLEKRLELEEKLQAGLLICHREEAANRRSGLEKQDCFTPPGICNDVPGRPA